MPLSATKKAVTGSSFSPIDLFAKPTLTTFDSLSLYLMPLEMKEFLKKFVDQHRFPGDVRH